MPADAAHESVWGQRCRVELLARSGAGFRRVQAGGDQRADDDQHQRGERYTGQRP